MTKMRSSRHDVTHEGKKVLKLLNFYYSLISERREFNFFIKKKFIKIGKILTFFVSIALVPLKRIFRLIF